MHAGINVYKVKDSILKTIVSEGWLLLPDRYMVPLQNVRCLYI